MSAASADGVRRVIVFEGHPERRVGVTSQTEADDDVFCAQDELVDLLAVPFTGCSLSCDSGRGKFFWKSWHAFRDQRSDR